MVTPPDIAPVKPPRVRLALHRLRRHALNLACALSAFLFISVAVLAVRGFWVQDLAQVAYQWYPTADVYHARWLGVRSLRGTIEVAVIRNDRDLVDRRGREHEWVSDHRQRNPQGFRGSYTTRPAAKTGMSPSAVRPRYVHEEGNRSADSHDEYWRLTVPSAYLLLIFAAVPAWFLWRAHRHRDRRRRGLCPHCGYDLRASGDVCPECGTLKSVGWGSSPPLLRARERWWG